MSPKKLTDDKKEEILNLYRHTEATFLSLASDYGVSSSTISRFLKAHLSESEYEDLIEQKRLSRTSKSSSKESKKKVKILVSPPSEDSEKPKTLLDQQEIKLSPSLSEESSEPKVTSPVFKSLILRDEVQYLKEDEDEDEDLDQVDVTALEEMLGEDLVGLDEDEDETEEEDDWEDDKETDYSKPITKENVTVQVLPLSEASFPNICYVVIDRAAELIVRPLKEFADLGRIPAEEVQQKTLPIFDSQKVARRFSRRFSSRSQRVIKVPDSSLFEKTGSYLQAKGITRILIDGQVYSL